ELFAGYSYMRKINDLEAYIGRTSRQMIFNSNRMGEFFGIEISQPFIDEKVVDLSLKIPADLKIKTENGSFHGKWILRKAFEGILPDEVIWQDKRPLERGSGMDQLRRIIEDKVSDEEFRQYSSSMRFFNKEHVYYYKIYRDVVGDIPRPKKGDKKCPGCGAGIKKDVFHCRVCGNVLKG
ncbi:MAG: asparagine synthase-related protein, partial [Candidatus Omnitrophota bacterium]